MLFYALTALYFPTSKKSINQINLYTQKTIIYVKETKVFNPNNGADNR